MISKKDFKEKGWKFQGSESNVADIYQLGNNIKMIYCHKAGIAKVNIVKFSGKEVEVANIKSLDHKKLSDATEILELNYVDLIKELLKNEY